MTLLRFFKKNILVGGGASNASYECRKFEVTAVPIMEEIAVGSELTHQNGREDDTTEHLFKLRAPNEDPIRAFIIQIRDPDGKIGHPAALNENRAFSLAENRRTLLVKITDGGEIPPLSVITVFYIV